MTKSIKLFLTFNLNMFDGYQGDATTSPGMSAEMKTYYEKNLLKEAMPNLVHSQFADKYPIPKNNGKTIELRKVNALPKNVNALVEGVTPAPNHMNIGTITATVDQYGDYVQLSDMVQMTTIDPMLVQSTEVLGSQAGRTLDSLTRDVINGGTSVIHANDKDRDTLTETDLLTVDLVFQAAALLKTQNAPKFDGDYIGIIHPLVAKDFMMSKGWIDVSIYGQPDKIYEGEIGKIGGVRFVESSEAKIFGPEEIFEGFTTLTVKEGSTGDTVSINETIPVNPGLQIPVVVNGVEATIIATTANGVVLDSPVNVAEGDVIAGIGGGSNGIAVFSTLIIGKGAYAETEITGGGLQHIVKQLGYGDDPLNQRASSGWKATHVAELLNQSYIVRIETGCSYSTKTGGN